MVSLKAPNTGSPRRQLPHGWWQQWKRRDWQIRWVLYLWRKFVRLFPTGEGKNFLTFQLFSLNTSLFFYSHFTLLSSVSFLPANPTPSRLFSFPMPGYQITRKANSVRPSTFLNPTPFFPFHRIFDGLIHQSTRFHHYRFSITSVLDNRKITAII